MVSAYGDRRITQFCSIEVSTVVFVDLLFEIVFLERIACETFAIHAKKAKLRFCSFN